MGSEPKEPKPPDGANEYGKKKLEPESGNASAPIDNNDSNNEFSRSSSFAHSLSPVPSSSRIPSSTLTLPPPPKSPPPPTPSLTSSLRSTASSSSSHSTFSTQSSGRSAPRVTRFSGASASSSSSSASSASASSTTSSVRSSSSSRLHTPSPPSPSPSPSSYSKGHASKRDQKERREDHGDDLADKERAVGRKRPAPTRKSTRVRKAPRRISIREPSPSRRKGKSKGKSKGKGVKGKGKKSKSRGKGNVGSGGTGSVEKGEDGTGDKAVSSGDEYEVDLYENYVGQVGALRVMDVGAGEVLGWDFWENALNDEERESLRAYLPQDLDVEDQDRLVKMVLSGERMFFGSPRDRIWDQVAAGSTHPRVKRWKQRVGLQLRRVHVMATRTYHNTLVRRLLAYKKPKPSTKEDFQTIFTRPVEVGAGGGPLTPAAASKNRAAAAAAAAQSSANDWDEERWNRVLDFRDQETERYNVPERAFVFNNPWGDSVVGPLKRGPALDGGRPREHVLLKNERPSHVTILCIVRDAASRLPNSRGTRADICDMVRDSQFLREGATFAQLNSVVSGALDRLHYEEDAPVKYDGEAKEWCYLHNDRRVEDFETPAWALQNAERRRKKAKKSRK